MHEGSTYAMKPNKKRHTCAMEVNPGPSCGRWVGMEGRGTKHAVGT